MRKKVSLAIALAFALGILGGVLVGFGMPQAAAQNTSAQDSGVVRLWSGGSIVGTWTAAAEPSIVNGIWAFNALSTREDGAIIHQPIMLTGTVSFERRLAQ